MLKNDWLKYCGNTPYTYNGLYNNDYSWNTWDVIQDLYDNDELTYQATEAIEKIDKLQKSVYNKNVKSKEQNEKEKETTMFDSNNFFGKLFGKVAPGQVRLSMNGDMAIKTSNGYKTYNVEDGSLTNCDNFVFDIGSEFFFIIPTNKVEKGDVILFEGCRRFHFQRDGLTRVRSFSSGRAAAGTGSAGKREPDRQDECRDFSENAFHAVFSFIFFAAARKRPAVTQAYCNTKLPSCQYRTRKKYIIKNNML